MVVINFLVVLLYWVVGLSGWVFFLVFIFVFSFLSVCCELVGKVVVVIVRDDYVLYLYGCYWGYLFNGFD